MSKFTFKFYAGLDNGHEEEITARYVKLVCGDGQKFELSPRKSDGGVVLSAGGQLGIEPRATNCVRITDTK